MPMRLLILLLAGLLLAQSPLAQAPPDFTCPMDPDVRSKVPGKCPRCGMKLEARIAEFARVSGAL